MGYGLKKANMFIRDMVELSVWNQVDNFDKIDVPSDINTMKLALRTGILKTAIPLLTSFLDIFCYQYEYTDEMSAKAWRTVWEQWKLNFPETALGSPAQMDYLLYRIGREYCKDNVVQYECEKGHIFYHFGANLTFCRVCSGSDRSLAHAKARFLPCQVAPEQLPRTKGVLLRPEKNLLRLFNGVCIFENTCRPKSPEFRALEPPKSISRIGQTSWTNSYSDIEKGGGGMMG
jgi:hypothetical protein